LSLVAILFFLKLVFAENQKNFVRCNFTRTLKIGSRGLDVFCLQVLLYQEGFLQNPLKSAGYYNLETKQAVKKWQAKNKISPTTGIFGPISISFYKNYYLQKNSTSFHTSTENNSTPSLPEIEKPEIVEKKLLTLSEIKDEEIKISPQGYSTFEDYLKFYFTDFNENLNNIINQDSEMSQYLQTIFAEAEKKKEIPSFSPYVYIKNYLDGNTQIDDLNKRLLFLRKFYEIKINELKKIEIDTKLKDLHKKFIANDYLEITLLDKFYAYQKGEISKNDLTQILNEYEKLKNKLLLETHSLTADRVFSVLSFFIKKVEAVTFIPFGGMIISVIPCTCPTPYGFVDQIGPPRPAIIFIPNTFLASPLNHLWRQILTQGVWTLGLYFTPPKPCLIWVKNKCAPASIQPWGTIFRSGTSLPPGL
jgi:peptidoglycan hydrolase-like protein with peptidoglycan-binding domain